MGKLFLIPWGMENPYRLPQLMTSVLKLLKKHRPEMCWPVTFIWLLTCTKYRHTKQIFLSPTEDGKEGKEKDDTIIFQIDEEICYENSRLVLQLVNDFLILSVPSDFKNRQWWFWNILQKMLVTELSSYFLFEKNNCKNYPFLYKHILVMWIINHFWFHF